MRCRKAGEQYMKTGIGMIAVLAAAVCAANLMQTAQDLRTVEQSVIRLHIRANSDSTADQTVKLAVRDALLEHAADWMPQEGDPEARCRALQGHLPEMQETARAALNAAGCGDAVSVSFGETAFPAREYGAVTLPAGTYRAVRVEIGSGEGQNWWCVMYPAMCVPAAAENAAEETLSGGALEIVTQPEKYEVRLKCVEVWRAVVRRIRTASAEMGGGI